MNYFGSRPQLKQKQWLIVGNMVKLPLYKAFLPLQQRPRCCTCYSWSGYAGQAEFLLHWKYPITWEKFLSYLVENVGGAPGGEVWNPFEWNFCLKLNLKRSKNGPNLQKLSSWPAGKNLTTVHQWWLGDSSAMMVRAPGLRLPAGNFTIPVSMANPRTWCCLATNPTTLSRMSVPWGAQVASNSKQTS